MDDVTFSTTGVIAATTAEDVGKLRLGERSLAVERSLCLERSDERSWAVEQSQAEERSLALLG